MAYGPWNQFKFCVRGKKSIFALETSEGAWWSQEPLSRPAGRYSNKFKKVKMIFVVMEL